MAALESAVLLAMCTSVTSAGSNGSSDITPVTMTGFVVFFQTSLPTIAEIMIMWKKSITLFRKRPFTRSEKDSDNDKIIMMKGSSNTDTCLPLADILDDTSYNIMNTNKSANRNTIGTSTSKTPSDDRMKHFSVRPVSKKEPVIPCVVCNASTASGHLTHCHHQVYCIDCSVQLVETCLKEGRLPKCNFIDCTAELSTEPSSLYS